MKHSQWTFSDLSWAGCQWTRTSAALSFTSLASTSSATKLYRAAFCAKSFNSKEKYFMNEVIAARAHKGRNFDFDLRSERRRKLHKIDLFFCSLERLETSNSIQFICNKIFLHRLCICTLYLSHWIASSTRLLRSHCDGKNAAGIGSSMENGFVSGWRQVKALAYGDTYSTGSLCRALELHSHQLKWVAQT